MFALDYPYATVLASAIFPRKFQLAGIDIFTDKCIENCKKWFQYMQLNVMPSIFLSRIKRSEALVNNSFFFFRTAVLQKYYSTYTVRFLYKHGIFSRGCLLVKMASKTVTMSIRLAKSLCQKISIDVTSLTQLTEVLTMLAKQQF